MKFCASRIIISSITLFLFISYSLQLKISLDKKNRKFSNATAASNTKAPIKSTNIKAPSNSTEATTPSNSTEATASSNSTGATNTNSTFDINNYPKIIEKAPYVVDSCDQILYIPGKVLNDLNDFSLKTDAFFTLSFYMVNYFEKKEANTLKESFSFDKMVDRPEIIFGTKSCLDFHYARRKFTMCLPDKETAQQIIDATDAFFKCRLGHDLSPAPIDSGSVMKILKDSCLGLDIKIDPDKFENKNAATAYYEVSLKQAMMSVANMIRKKNNKSSNAPI